MNLGAYIQEYLQEKGHVDLPTFGSFSMLKKNAILDTSHSKILPPTQEISFVSNPAVFDNSLSKFIADKTGENLFIIQSKIKEELKSWEQIIAKDKELHIEGFGKFYITENKITFSNSLNYDANPHFFGLEEISLRDINQDHETIHVKETDNQYVFNNSILWVFLLILPLGALLYLGLSQREKIFGKNSFEKISAKTSTKRIEKKNIDSTFIKNDSTQIFIPK